MSKRLSILIVVYFSLALTVPSLVWLSGYRVGNIENTRDSVAPEFSLDKLSEPQYFQSLSRYIVEQNPIRPPAVYANAWLDYRVFQDGKGGRVLQGKDGWFFYQPSIIRSCPRAGAVSAISRYAHSSAALFQAHNKSFLLSIAPNKHSIYPEYGSIKIDALSQCANAWREQLLTTLGTMPNESFLNIHEHVLTLKNAEPGADLYIPLDTHWTSYQAAKYARKLIAAQGYTGPLRVERLAPAAVRDWLPDLSKFMGLQLRQKQDIYIARSDHAGKPQLESIDYAVSKGRRLLVNQQNIPSDSNQLAKRVLVIYDSFMYPAMPSLASHFDEAIYVHWDTIASVPTAELMAGADTVIVEIVERDAPNALLRKLPDAATLDTLKALLADPARSSKVWNDLLAQPRRPSSL